MSNTLMLHAGAAVATLAEVANVKTPDATETWQPISHLDVINLVRGQLESRDMTIVNESYGLWRDGQRLFGMMELRNGHNEHDYSLVVGIRNSHDKSFPAGAVLGSRVFVCDNLAFSGEVRFSRKHTSQIKRDLPILVNAAVGKLIDARVGQAQRIEAYKQFELNDVIAHDVMIRSLDVGIAVATKMPQIVKEWRTPQYDDFKPRTAWSLFNAFTEALKGNLAQLPRRTQALHGLMDRVVGIETVTATALVEADETPVADYEIVE